MMNRRRVFTGLSLLSITFAIGAHLAPFVCAAEAPFCEVIKVQGHVTATDAGGTERMLKAGDVLQEGETLEVGLSAYADLAYDKDHRNVTRVEADSELAIRTLSPQEIRLKMKMGGVFAKLKKLPRNSSFEVVTPTAIASVRGSEYRTTYREDTGARVYNFGESMVTVSAVDTDGNAVGQPVTLENLEKTKVVKSGESPQAPQKMSKADVDDADTEGLSGGKTQADAEQASEALREMAKAYENKDASGFFSYVSDDFSYRGELEEFTKRDFRDYDGIKVNLFLKRAENTPGGVTIRADWQIQFMPMATSTPVEVRGDNLDFVFVYEGGRYKLKAQRGASPLFGGRSPDIAAQSGVSGTVVRALTDIEDIGSREAKQSAMILVGTSETTNRPVNVEIVATEVFITPSTVETVPGIISISTQHQPQVRVRLTDNPGGIDLIGIVLEVTDSRTGTVMRGTGNLLAGQINTIRTSDTFTTSSPTNTGTLTYVLDPDRLFNLIDRNAARTSAAYTSS